MIKDLPLNARPRERLARYGSEVLSTVELLAILLGSGTQSRPVLQLAEELLAHFGSLHALSEASLEEMMQVKGIGKVKATQLTAVFGLLAHLQKKEPHSRLDSPEKIYELIRSDLSNAKVEMLMVIARDIKRRWVHQEIVSKGTLTELLIHPREIFHIAIRHRAHSLIIAHNHPSGDTTPSAKDLEMTGLLAHAGKVVGIELSDHLIVGRNGYMSFFQKGLLRRENGSVY